MSDNPRFDAVSLAFKRAVEYLHKHKGYKPEMLADAPLRELIEATRGTLAEPLQKLSVSQEIPPELTGALDENIFWFSGFKTHHELVEASRLLKDNNGGFKPFEQYLQDVRAIDNTYNRNYLNAEYNFATASTQMAVKWKEWEKDGDRYDLQYRTAGDDRVREEHAALDGTTLPPSDPFWNHYLPPNGWNCRCTTVQVRKGKYPRSDSKEAIARGQACTDKPKQQIFRFNPGKQEKIFPPKHPYFPKGCGDCQYRQLSYDSSNPNCQACKAVQKCIERAKSLHTEVVKTFKNGGLVEAYANIDKTTDDYKRIEKAAMEFARKGETVVITPKFDSPKNCPDYDAIYGSLKGTDYYGKCPDLKIGEVWYEHEGFTGNKPKNSFRNMCNHGFKQSDKIIIENCGLTDGYMLRSIAGQIKSGTIISEVIIHSKNGNRVLYKKTEG